MTQNSLVALIELGRKHLLMYIKTPQSMDEEACFGDFRLEYIFRILLGDIAIFTYFGGGNVVYTPV